MQQQQQDSEEDIQNLSAQITEVLAALKVANLTVGKLSVADFTIGIKYHIAETRKLRLQIPDLELQQHSLCPPCNDQIILQHLILCGRLMEWSYGTEKAFFDAIQSLRDIEVLNYIFSSSHNRPAFISFANKRTRTVFLVIRGTASARDVFTDCTCTSEQFENGHAHSGMLQSARWILKESLGNLQSFASQGYHIWVLGHSLGGGVAALVSSLLNENPVFRSRVRCFAFSPAACTDQQLSVGISSFVTSVVFGDDIVPRFTPHSAERLRQHLRDSDWSKRLAKLVANKTPAPEAAMAIGGAAFSLAKAVGNKVLEKVKSPKPADGPACVDAPTAATNLPPPQEELHPPGRVMHIFRKPGGYAACWVSPLFFSDITLSPTMTADHRLGNVVSSLQSLAPGCSGGVVVDGDFLPPDHVLRSFINPSAIGFQF